MKFSGQDRVVQATWDGWGGGAWLTYNAISFVCSEVLMVLEYPLNLVDSSQNAVSSSFHTRLSKQKSCSLNRNITKPSSTLFISNKTLKQCLLTIIKK